MNGASPPRITRVMLRRGTAYRANERDRVTERRVLEQDTEVGLVWLALSPGETGLFRLDDGQVIRVRYEDDLRGPRAAE